MTHALTIDLEEWFCSHNLESAAPYASWERLESRIERNTNYALDRLGRQGVNATFFVLGWIAERYPELVATIAAEGHEIASHGYAHKRLTAVSPSTFEADLRRSLEVLRDVSPQPVLGYRAPAFSVVERTLWALEVIEGCGLRYDSSIHPLRFHPDYGLPHAELGFHMRANGLIEAPVTCAPCFRLRIPCGGGAYFRLMPYAVHRALVGHCLKVGQTLVFYIHPWEWDSGMPRLAVPVGARLRHYTNTKSVKGKFEALLADYPFAPLSAVLVDQGLLSP